MIGKWPSVTDDELRAVERVLRSGKVNYWTGSECRSFEAEFAELCGAKYAISLANGTVALDLALSAIGIEPDDEVVVTPRTFIASASSIALRGGRPVFADVDPDTQNITAESVKSVMSDRTTAVIAVHHAGWPCEMDDLMELAREHGLKVIEDCAQAHFAAINSKPVGSIGDVGAFSFCQDKIMTTGGEGGMLVTNDSVLWRRAWAFKDHGKSWDAVQDRQNRIGFRWLHESFGTNGRMTEMQAAIGRVQLGLLPEWHRRRAENARILTKALQRYLAVRVPEVPAHVRHAYYRLYAFVVPQNLAGGWHRDRIMEELIARDLPVAVGSCPEVYLEKAFNDTGCRPEHPCSVARELGLQSLAFLVHPTLTDEDLTRSVSAIDDVLSQASERSRA